jgi:molybdopterin-guanine dinucleotide biosynthesis protein A
MGVDKAFVAVDGLSMVQRVAGALSGAGADPVTCIGGDRTRLGNLGLPSIEDGWPGEGPLGGVVSALEHALLGTIVVAACDQPWLTPSAITALVEQHRAIASAVTVYRAGGRLQPLPGIYDTSVLATLRAALDRGERALHEALAPTAPATITAPVDVLEALRDVDTPVDLPPASDRHRLHPGPGT